MMDPKEVYVPQNGDFIAFDYGKFGWSFGIFENFSDSTDYMRLHLCFPGGKAVSELLHVYYRAKGLRRATDAEIAQCVKLVVGNACLPFCPARENDYVKMISHDGSLFYGLCAGASARFLYFEASVVDDNGEMDENSILFDSEILRSRIASDIEPMTPEEIASFKAVVAAKNGELWRMKQIGPYLKRSAKYFMEQRETERRSLLGNIEIE